MPGHLYAGDGARWEFSLRTGNPCMASRDTGTGGSPAPPAPVGSAGVGSSPGEAGEERAGRASSFHFSQFPRLLSVLPLGPAQCLVVPSPSAGAGGIHWQGGSLAVNLGSGHALLVPGTGPRHSNPPGRKQTQPRELRALLSSRAFQGKTPARRCLQRSLRLQKACRGCPAAAPGHKCVYGIGDELRAACKLKIRITLPDGLLIGL